MTAAPPNYSALLLSALSPSPAVRVPAETTLRELENASFSAHLYNLCERLGDESEQPEVRKLAGVILKNAFVSREEQTKLALAQRWLMLEEGHREAIKAKVLEIMGSRVKEARSTASQVIASVAAIEVSRHQWASFMDVLFQQLAPQSTAETKESALEVLDFIAEDLSEVLRTKSGSILNIIRNNLAEGTDSGIKLAAIKALVSSLDYAADNMDIPAQRQLIMEMIFGTAVNNEDSVRYRAYQALVKVGTLYYQYVPEFFDGCQKMTAFAIEQALKGQSEAIGMQGIEFWSSMCDWELELTLINQDHQARTGEVAMPFLNIVQRPLQLLLPLLFQCLQRQGDEVGDDTWNLASAAGHCLTSAAQVVGDEIVDLCLPFVQANIQSADWRLRDAATLIFGAILGGPTAKKLDPLVAAAFPLILTHLQDQSDHVRDTAIWTVGRICECAPHTLVPNEQMLAALNQSFLVCLQREPRIASLTCWAIHNLVSSVQENYNGQPTSPLSPFFNTLVQALYAVTQREDSDESSLLSSAFEAMNLLVLYSSEDCVATVQELFVAALTRMSSLSQSAEGTVQETQGYLCSCIHACITKVPASVMAKYADQVMLLLLQILQNQNALLYEEALMAVGAVINVLKENFRGYIVAFRPFLMAALQNVQDHQVNVIAVSVVSDLCSALGTDISPLCDDIVTAFLSNLQSATLDREAKPVIIAAIGDLALAIGANFNRYLSFVMMVIVQACQTQIQDPSDPNQVDFLNALRLSILEALVGIVTALREGRVIDAFNPFAESTIQFLDIIANDKEKDERILAAAVGLIGDLVSAFGKRSAHFVGHPSIGALLKEAEEIDDEAIRESAEYASTMISMV